jgi:quercetin dioxygenase-like cupin family protein/ketosteroid isomerase-like protein
MAVSQTLAPRMTRAQMDALVEGHYRAEEEGDLDAIVDGFTTDAEHDVAGRPGEPLHGADQIEAFYRALLAELRIDRFEPVRRWYGEGHVVDEAVLHATAVGRPFGLEGRGRPVRARFLHIFDFADGLISRESAWIDLAAIQHQLSSPNPGGKMSTPTTAPGLKNGDARWFFGTLATIRATAADTDGQYTLVEVVAPPGLKSPLHVHHTEDEAFLIMEGDVVLEVGDERIEAAAGQFTFGPRDVPHRFEVGPAGAHMLWVLTPAGFENLIEAVSVPAEEMTVPPPGVVPPENAAEIVTRYGNEILV